jgi:hypothetical protein
MVLGTVIPLHACPGIIESKTAVSVSTIFLVDRTTKPRDIIQAIQLPSQLSSCAQREIFAGET